MYREQPSRVPGGFVWSSVSTGDTKRVLPDGCMDLLWDRRRISIAGPDTHAQLVASATGSTLVGLRFAPGYAPRVLGVPAGEFADRARTLDAVWAPAEVRRITDLLASGSEAARTLESIALARVAHADDDDDDAELIEQVALLANAGCNSTTIADRIGLSTRQLQRKSVAAFGYGAKTLGRILRMQRALTLVRTGERPASSAAQAGYADQSHLARDVKELAGVPITLLVN